MACPVVLDALCTPMSISSLMLMSSMCSARQAMIKTETELL